MAQQNAATRQLDDRFIRPGSEPLAGFRSKTRSGEFDASQLNF